MRMSQGAASPRKVPAHLRAAARALAGALPRWTRICPRPARGRPDELGKPPSTRGRGARKGEGEGAARKAGTRGALGEELLLVLLIVRHCRVHLLQKGALRFGHVRGQHGLDMRHQREEHAKGLRRQGQMLRRYGLEPRGVGSHRASHQHLPTGSRPPKIGAYPTACTLDACVSASDRGGLLLATC